MMQKKAFEEWYSKSEVDKYVTWSKHKNVDVTKNLFRIWEEDYKDLSTFRWIVELVIDLKISLRL